MYIHKFGKQLTIQLGKNPGYETIDLGYTFYSYIYNTSVR